jgi:hypothetical protein
MSNIRPAICLFIKYNQIVKNQSSLTPSISSRYEIRLAIEALLIGLVHPQPVMLGFISFSLPTGLMESGFFVYAIVVVLGIALKYQLICS